MCIICIFFGSASENTMTGWCSGYLEAALRLPKLVGDVFGVALFAVMLGAGRSLYAKFGKNISRFMLFGFSGAFICYLTAALSPVPLIGLVACVLTGFFVSMLWPGTLIFTADMIPNAGVTVYALLAAGGDLGGSVGPQLVGSLTDAVSADKNLTALFPQLMPEQIGLKVGMLSASVFPLVGIIIMIVIRKYVKRRAEIINTDSGKLQ